MILRRFMKHVADQNWFAVGLDVIVVIVGIFLGLQVQAWYEAREDREQELFYLHQLHEEIDEAEPYGQDSFARISFMDDVLDEILTPYRENIPFETFSTVQCNAIVRSHVITNFIAPITTIEELEQTGRALIIQNEELRHIVSVYKSAKNSSDRQIALMKDDAVNLPSKYSQIIDRRGAGRGFDIVPVTGNTCNAALASEHIDFGNDLIGNANRMNAYNRLMAKQIDALRQLHLVLDAELGITHDES